MAGYNHHPWCVCGWCVKERQNHGSGRTIFKTNYTLPGPENPSSYINPNALCPVCGAEVFFYKSPEGGRVFFDELGPPWPKHPCTDHGDTKVKLLRLYDKLNTDRPKSSPLWQDEGWEPICIKSPSREWTWDGLLIERLKTGFLEIVLTERRIELAGQMYAHIREWDHNGWSEISYLSLNGGLEPKTIPVYELDLHRETPASSAIATRNRFPLINTHL